MKTSELKPCPFCGGDPEIARIGTSRQSMIISCVKCGCRLESSDTAFISPTTWSWNIRDNLQGRIEGIMMAAEIPDSMRGEGESDLRCVSDRIKALAKNLPIDNSKG